MALMSRRVFLLAAGLVVTGCGAAPLDAVTVDPQSLSMGLVAHWTFDEGSGTTVGDHSGNGHDGVLTGGTWTGSGRFGGALQLALGDNVTVSSFPSATPDWTISGWVQMSAAQLATNVGTADYGTIISTEIAFTGGWQMELDDNPGHQRFDAAYYEGPMSSGSYIVDNDCECVVTDQWIHLTAVFDNDAQQFTLYQNDSVVDRMMMPAAIQSGDSTLYFGKWTQAARFLAADLDDFAIWDRALSAGEVAVISQQPPPD
jgi:hypothetical protein